MKTDWEIIKTAYVTSNKDMIEVAEAFKVNFDVLRRHAAKEKWTEQRKLFRVTTAKQASEKRSTEMATDIAQFSSDELKLVKAIYALSAEEIKARKPARDIATAIKSAQEIRIRATGETTDEDKSVTIKVEYDKE
jgi:hypothetical protein